MDKPLWNRVGAGRYVGCVAGLTLRVERADGRHVNVWRGEADPHFSPHHSAMLSPPAYAKGHLTSIKAGKLFAEKVWRSHLKEQERRLPRGKRKEGT